MLACENLTIEFGRKPVLKNVSLDPRAPIATLPHTIFTYAISPYDDWHRLAWGGALVLVLGILGATLLSRFVLWWHQRSLQH